MSEHYACPHCDFSIPELEPRMFSFNAPYGACPECKGLGVKLKIDIDLIIPNKDLSINEGGIVSLNLEDSNSIISTQINTLAKYYNIDLDKPIKNLTKKELDIVLYGSPDILDFNYVAKNGNTRNSKDYFEGIITNLERRYIETKSGWIRDWIENYMTELTCPVCDGARLDSDVLSVLINKKNIYELTKMSIKQIKSFKNYF